MTVLKKEIDTEWCTAGKIKYKNLGRIHHDLKKWQGLCQLFRKFFPAARSVRKCRNNRRFRRNLRNL
jgi:hypothetical protein